MGGRLRSLPRIYRSIDLLLTSIRASSTASSTQLYSACPAIQCLRDFHQSSSFDKVNTKLFVRLSSALGQQRTINVDQHGTGGEELSEKDYHRFSDLTLGELLAKLEALIEETPDLADSDLEYQQGVLTLNLGSHGTYVINKQSPNKQIWMSSPVSGPVRYDFVDGRWIYKHDGHAFHERLSQELKELTGRKELDLEFEPQLEKGFVGYGADPT